jgi:histidinol-phosphate aminotransferase
MSYQYEVVARPASGLRLHLNENTAGCSPKVLDAIRGVSREDVAFYPGYDDAIRLTAARIGVAEDQVVLTNGLDEGILALTIAALRERGSARPEAIVVVPAFDMYASTADGVGARVVEVPLGPDFAFPADEVIAAVTPQTRLLFLTSPNNPTGLSIPHDDVERIARAAPHVRILVDEAYIDFGGRTLVGNPRFAALTNVFVGRTFAKAYGLAGIRAGTLIGDASALAAVRRVVPPFSINACAAVALTAALDDVEYYDWYRDQVRQSRALLYSTLDAAGMPFWRSDANFVLARFGDRAREIAAGLAARGVHVRDKSQDPACPGCLRITTGVVEHTQACIRALEEVL